LVAAHILIQVEAGTTGQVVKGLEDIDEVRSALGVNGPFDVIATAEAGSLDALGRLVVTRIHSIPGITRTLTCPILHLDAEPVRTARR
jgi:DNA-binding Lrp family transcriptional regulator